MALQLSKLLGDGTTGNYWVVDTICIYKEEARATVKMSLYMDQTTKQGLKEPMSSVVFELNGSDFPFDLVSLKSKDPFALSYEKIKAMDAFKTASDV